MSAPEVTSAAFRYSAFGLTLASEIELPELAPFDGDEAQAPEVHIRLGQTPNVLDGSRALGPGAFAKPGAFLLDVPAAQFLVTGGTQIQVQPKASASARDLRGYLLGSAIGALCMQRGVLPLHANAIVGDDGATAFAGPSGVGKSTLAAHLLDQGRSVLCDDVCVITAGEREPPQAWPGVARIKLWPDALATLGRSPAGLEPVFDGESKLSLLLPQPLARRPAPLRTVYILSADRNGASPAASRLAGRIAIEALLANVYRWEFAAALGVAGVLFAKALAVANACPIFELRLPSGPAFCRSQLEDLNRLLNIG